MTAPTLSARLVSGVGIMRVLLGQLASALGDVDANLNTATKVVAEAAAQDVDLVVFPELFLHGYALGRIGDDRSIPATDERLRELSTLGPDVLIGYHEDGGSRTYNTASYLCAGRTVHPHRKLFLPTYLTWEERKHVNPGQSMRSYDTPFGRMATLLCNDAWQAVLPWLAVQDGAEVLLVPTNSATSPDPARTEPVSLDTVIYWQQLLISIARMQQCWVVFVNRVGIEAGVTFWGGSQVINPSGEIIGAAPKWHQAMHVVDIDVHAAKRRRRSMPLVNEARLGLIGREIDRLIKEGGDA
ncbi:carbon-nitrogen hydrolase [Fodinicola feengrottensis]|uniref:Carbon-nitrogen hydrolase n=2 Tax=Fodinicola feengrottensis TaxID=435914 RepID=A0ABN2GK40_9ACTN